jgi:hypothetical protein
LLEHYSGKWKYITAVTRIITMVSEMVFLPTYVLYVTLMILGDRIHITYRRRRYGVAENIFQSGSEGEENMGDRKEQPKDNAIHILSDLARAQNDIVRVQSVKF